MAVLDLIQVPDERSDEMVHRLPEHGSGEFRLGSQLVVRESQRAIFVRDGKALDTFGPGRHTLSTNNIPLLTRLIGLPFGGTSPFTAEAFFVSTREFTDLKWGTPQPLLYRDAELSMVRLRAFGTYSMRVADPALFVGQVVGAQAAFKTGAIDDFLRTIIIGEFNDVLGEVSTSILDIQGMTREIADTVRTALGDDFSRLGLQMSTFQISAITPPEDVQKLIDERSGMAAIGDMSAYTKFKTARAIGDAAQNSGGSGDVAATGIGLGAGLGMGQAMAEAMRAGNAPASTPPTTAAATTTCPNCRATIPAGSKFCPNCGHSLQPQTVTCPECATENAAGAKFCTNCGTDLQT